MPRRHLLAMTVLALVTVLPACTSQHKTVNLGLRKITLDLTFKARNGQKTSLAQVVAAQEPVAASTQALGNVVAPASIAPITLSPLACATAAEGAVPEEPVTGAPVGLPVPGTYLQHNVGTYAIDGVIKLSGEFPFISALEIANVADQSTTDQLGNTTRTIGYDLIERNLLSTTTTRYQSVTRSISRTDFATAPSAIASELELVSAETKSGGTTTAFHPSPPVTIMQYDGEGALWNSTGVDEATGTTMVVQGKIASREPIDVCGTMVDTFRVESTEQVTNPLTGYNSQTNSSSPNVYNIATQFGGLMVRQTTDTTTTFTVNGSPLTLVVKNAATVTSIKPFKAAAAS